MTSIKSCAALGAILVLSVGAAMAQSYGPDQPGDPSGYGPPPPPPGDPSEDRRGYGPPPPDGQWGQGANSAQARPYGDQGDAFADQRDEYTARMARYHAQQARYRQQLHAYEHARRDYDMQFGPGAYERYYAAPPPPPGE